MVPGNPDSIRLVRDMLSGERFSSFFMQVDWTFFSCLGFLGVIYQVLRSDVMMI